MEPTKRNLEAYADLVIRVGVNLQKGQKLIILANTATAPFVRELTRKAYEAGAKNVYVEWDDEEVKRIKFLYAPDEAFLEYPSWKAKGLVELAKEGAAIISVYAPNPDLLSGISPDRVATADKTAAVALEEWRSYIFSGAVHWSMASVPTPQWAARVFPDKSEEEAVQALWDSIFRVNRINTDNPVKSWQDHIRTLAEKVEILNAKRYKALIYKGPGTDLRVELPENHLWVGGSQEGTDGIPSVHNLPTEEVFTLPKKDGVHGTVSSTKPLNYSGQVIDQFTLTFEQGRIVNFTAKTGYDLLKKLIETDEGSHYLGEVALVAHDSPVSNLNITFYNTMFDENASCHLAIGNAYPATLKDGTSLSKDELTQQGANSSLTHVDFMIGSSELDIDAERADGTLEPLFRKGNWAL